MRTLAKLLFYVALIAVPLMGASLWLDGHGETATGPVTGKREEISAEHEPTGGWRSRRYVEVDIPRLAAVGLRASVRVDSAEFAAIHSGDRVGIRYFPCCPIFARLDGRTTPQVTWEALRELGSSPVLDWAVGGVVALVIAAQLGTVFVVAVGLAWVAAAALYLFPALPPRAASGVEATARVAGVAMVNQSPARSHHRSRSTFHPERLTVPYQIVQLRLIPAGGTDSVLAVDEVDAGSVPSLAYGALIKVRYLPEAPREAMLVDGTRSFRQRNRFHFLLPVVGLSSIGIAAGLSWRLRGRRRTVAAA